MQKIGVDAADHGPPKIWESVNNKLLTYPRSQKQPKQLCLPSMRAFNLPTASCTPPVASLDSNLFYSPLPPRMNVSQVDGAPNEVCILFRAKIKSSLRTYRSKKGYHHPQSLIANDSSQPTMEPSSVCEKSSKTNICGASQEDFTIINGETLKDPLSAVSKKNLRITTSGAQLDDIYAYVHSKCLTVDQVW